MYKSSPNGQLSVIPSFRGVLNPWDSSILVDKPPLAGPLPASLSLPYLVQGGAHLVTTLGSAPQGVWDPHGAACPMHPMAGEPPQVG